jgi:putative SOS response-associated peptidase YedK
MEEDGPRATAKVPTLIERKERSRHGWPLGTVAESKNGAVGDTFAVITTDPNSKMAEIHNRQQVILEPREYAEWLEESERPPVHLLRILPDADMTIAEIEPPPKAEDPPPMQSGFLFDR